MHLTLNSCVTGLLKIDAHPAYGGTALFRRPVLAEHLRVKRSNAKSRSLAGLLNVIYYF
jgi:hypothetical protein